MSELLQQPLKDYDDYDRRSPRTIEAAAVLDTTTGTVYWMPRPNRHWSIVHAMDAIGLKQCAEHEQGFLTSDGYFARRTPAKAIAEKAGQLVEGHGKGPRLFSEDVW